MSAKGGEQLGAGFGGAVQDEDGVGGAVWVHLQLAQRLIVDLERLERLA